MIMASIFSCRRCGEEFTSANSLNHHESRKHDTARNANSEGGDVARCPVCFLHVEVWYIAAHNKSAFHARQVQLLEDGQNGPIPGARAHGGVNQTVPQIPLTGRSTGGIGGGGARGGARGGGNVHDGVGSGSGGGGGGGGAYTDRHGAGGRGGGGGGGYSPGSDSPDKHDGESRDGARGCTRDWMDDRSDVLGYDSHVFVGRVVLLPLPLNAAANASELRERAKNWQK